MFVKTSDLDIITEAFFKSTFVLSRLLLLICWEQKISWKVYISNTKTILLEENANSNKQYICLNKGYYDSIDEKVHFKFVHRQFSIANNLIQTVEQIPFEF